MGLGQTAPLISANAFQVQEISANTLPENVLATPDEMGSALLFSSVNQDSTLDLITGLPGGANGRVLTFFLDEQQTPIAAPVETLAPTGLMPDVTEFGASLAWLGDINNDNNSDILIGAPGRMSGNGGRVFIYSMQSSGVAAPLLPNTVIDSTTAGLNLVSSDTFGTAVALLDISPDIDIAVSSLLGSGSVYIFTLASDGSATLRLTISSGSSGFVFLDPDDRFGSSISSIGDLNGDGIDDVVVGAEFDDDGNDNTGAIYLLIFSNNFILQSTIKISNLAGNLPSNLLQLGDEFGSAVQPLSLVGNNLLLAVGAESVDSSGAPGSGAIIILTVSQSGLVLDGFYASLPVQNNIIPNPTDGINFGSAITSIELPNGAHRLAVGVPHFIGAGVGTPLPSSGAILVFNLNICGDMIISDDESCEDGNLNDGDGCSSACQVEVGFFCDNTFLPSLCTIVCGDGMIISPEFCDDNNTVDGDGCSSSCELEDGFVCLPSICQPECGDGQQVGTETCDDGNMIDGDGCSSTCNVESSNSDENTIILVAVLIPLIVCCLFMIIAILLSTWFFEKKGKDALMEMEMQSMNVTILTDIQIGKIIGSGEFGNVYKGLWNDTQVALKGLKSDSSDFSHELKLMIELRHPNVLILYGVARHEGQFFMVTEFMNQGDLLKLLHNDAEITSHELIDLAKQTCRGMEYLHSQNILHRDLACRNLLVSGSERAYTCKISDFGLSRKSENYYKSESKTIPIRWTAPEVIEFNKSTTSSDVWSFGVVLWEIFSRGAIPYAGMSNKKVFEKVKEGFRLNPPTSCPSKVALMMRACWKASLEARPTFKDMLLRFENISDQEGKENLQDPSASTMQLQLPTSSTVLPAPVMQITKETSSKPQKNTYDHIPEGSTTDRASFYLVDDESLPAPLPPPPEDIYQSETGTLKGGDEGLKSEVVLLRKQNTKLRQKNEKLKLKLEKLVGETIYN